MSWDSEAIDIMRGNGSGGGSSLKLAVMTGPKSCKIGNLVLNAEDLKIDERLLSQCCTQVKETAPGGGGLCSDQSTYLPALKAGDEVIVYQLSDSKFLILAKVVDP